MEQARTIIHALGGATRVAEALRLPRTTVQNWTHRGIAARYLPALQRLAEHIGVSVDVERGVPTLRRLDMVDPAAADQALPPQQAS